MFWGLRLLVTAPVAPAYTVSALDGAGLRGDLARVFGSSAPAVAVAAAPTAQASRFKLVGVAAPRDANVQGGLALISVDGKPARAINVGRTIDDGWVLQSVNRRGARLASNLGANTVDLEMPALALASRGTLPPVGASINNASPGPLPIVPPPGGPLMPSAGPAANGAPGGGSAPFGMPGGAADGRSIANPIAMPPSPTAPQSGPPAIFVPAEELTRPVVRSRAPKVNGVEGAASGVQ